MHVHVSKRKVSQVQPGANWKLCQQLPHVSLTSLKMSVELTDLYEIDAHAKSRESLETNPHEAGMAGMHITLIKHATSPWQVVYVTTEDARHQENLQCDKRCHDDMSCHKLTDIQVCSFDAFLLWVQNKKCKFSHRSCPTFLH